MRLAEGHTAENHTAAAFRRLSAADLLRVLKAIHERRFRYCARLAGLGDRMIAEVLGLDATADRR